MLRESIVMSIVNDPTQWGQKPAEPKKAPIDARALRSEINKALAKWTSNAGICGDSFHVQLDVILVGTSRSD